MLAHSCPGQCLNLASMARRILLKAESLLTKSCRALNVKLLHKRYIENKRTGSIQNRKREKKEIPVLYTLYEHNKYFQDPELKTSENPSSSHWAAT